MKFKHLSILLTSMLITTSAFAQEYIATSSKISNIVVKPGNSGSGSETPPPVNTNNAVGFENDYAPSNWSNTGTASVGVTFNSSSLTITAPGGGGGRVISITVPNSGIITFDWEMTVYAAGQYGDRISYAVNGTQTHLSTMNSNSGSVASVAVNAGDTFEFSTWGTTSSSNYSASITNFTFTE